MFAIGPKFLIIFNNIFRLEAAVLDLVADDGTGIKTQRSMYHWDKVMLKLWLNYKRRQNVVLKFYLIFLKRLSFISYKLFHVRGVKSTSS